MKKYYLFILLQTVFIINIFAQSDEHTKLSAFVKRALETTKIIPAISITVVDKTGTIFSEGFGYASIENGILATSQTDFYIASCTKSFNGLLLAILAQEEQIDLYKNITDYKPLVDFANDDVFKNITIMDLLSHQSGIDNDYLSFKLAYTGDYTSGEILKLIENETKKNEDGNTFEYTNFGYYLIDIILQEEFGINWRVALKEKLFMPLNMTNTTGFISNLANDQLAQPYLGVLAEKLKLVELKKTDKTMHAAGGLVSTGEDIGKFLSLYINKGFVNERQLIPQKLIENTYDLQVSANHKGVNIFKGVGYAMGWRLGEFYQDEVAYHFGSYPGYFSHISFLPKKNIGVAIFINNSLGMPIANIIAKYAYDLYLGNKTSEDEIIGQINTILNKYKEMQDSFDKKSSERTWQLLLPKTEYVGDFHNDKIGTFNISIENDELVVKIANLISIGTPYPKDNCLRVELIPYSGSVMCFNIENEIVKSINYKNKTFIKM